MDKNINFTQMMLPLGPSHFEFNIDDGNCAVGWRNWLRGFELFAKASGIDDSSPKMEWLLTCAGPKVQDIYFNLPDNNEEKENKGPLTSGYVPFVKDQYSEAVLKLQDFFAPKRNVSYERHVFRKIMRTKNERIDYLIMRLRVQAERCDFGNQLDENIKEQITIGCNSILERGDDSLDSIVKMARIMEAVSDQQKDFASENQKENSSTQAENNVVPQSNEVCMIDTVRQGYKQKMNFTRPKNFGECTCCGMRNHRRGDSRCPAKGKECFGCGKLNHFKQKCLTKHVGDMGNYQPPEKSKRESIRMLQATESVRMIQPTRSQSINNIVQETRNPIEYDDIFCIFSEEKTTNRIWCKIGGVELEVIVDSGTRFNIIDRETWTDLQTKQIKIISFQREVEVGFNSYGGHKLKVIGMLEAVIQVNKMKTPAKFYVTDEVGKVLIGYETAIFLKVLKIESSVNNVENNSNKQLSTIRGILVEIPIDENIKPVQQPYRRIPAPIEKIVGEKISSLLQEGIIEKVETSKWISPLVIQPKPDGDVRVCVDMRRANEAVVREYNPLPTIDEFLPYLGSSTVFSKIDVRQAFHQVEISEKSREITTFITKTEMFRYKRLMFGIKCAPEIFQKIMEQLLRGCGGCCIFMDDVLVHGETKQHHDRHLENFLNRLKKFNVILNDKKCVFGVPSVVFLGHILSEKCIQPADDKVDSIRRFREPRTVEEVRSFLGIVNYVGKFIPDLSTIAEPLRQLTRSGNQFVWGKEQQNAFDKLKLQLTKETTLGYYNTKDRTRIIADASPVGLGAVLVQFQASGPRVISNASRSLSQAERKYAQPEKEALALVWAVEKFHFYVFGREFELVADHESLEKIFSTLSRPCARIERLQSYKFKVIYQPGKTNIADALSRLVRETTNSDAGYEDEEYINWIVKQAEPKAINLKEISEASKSDKTILAVKKGVFENDWNNEDLSLYKNFQTELCLVGEILLRSTKIVLPECFWERAMELAHEGHPGMSVIKRRLRAKVWWPKMDQQIEKFIRKCKGCTLVSAPSAPEPLKRRELPSAPWEHLAIDYLGPLPSGHNVLVIVDYYSRYIEAEVMSGKIDSTQTIKRLKQTFARFGLPLSIQADNGSQFISAEFEDYCEMNNIHLNNSIPYWPQENGEVERQNRSLLKRLQISQAEKRDWLEDLQDYLLMYRSTPHSTTLRSPAKMLFNQKIRDKLPTLQDVTIMDDDEIRDRDKTQKEKGKDYADEKRNAKFSENMKGDQVVLKRQVKSNKLSTMFEPTVYVVLKRIGSEIVVENSDTGSVYRRNVAHAKKVRLDDPAETPENPIQPQMNEKTLQMKETEKPTSTETIAIPKFSSEKTLKSPEKERVREEPLFSERKRMRRMPEKYLDYVVKNPSGGKKEK